MEEYRAIISGGVGEIIEKKSRFIGYTAPAESEEAAAAFIDSIRKKHYDARHNCFAYSLGTNKQPLERCSDDGEPQGTAGKPILEVIKGSGIRNICIVVTRYFGGTLLGTGGLVRAYTEAARAGIAASQIHTVRSLTEAKMEFGYTELGRLNYLIEQTDAVITGTEYTDTVTMTVRVYTPVYEAFVRQVTETTGGTVEVVRLAEVFA